jgi:hypothetical protein
MLALFNKLPQVNAFAIILVAMSILLFFVRSYIETDAMIRARYLAKEYMEQNIDLIGKNNIGIILDNYDSLNEIGVKFYNLKLLFDYLVKIIVFCIVALI